MSASRSGAAGIRVLMIAQHVNFFRNLDTVMRELCRRGHEVVFLHGTRLDDPRVEEQVQKRKKLVFRARGLKAVESEIEGVTSGNRPEPPEHWQRVLSVGRQVVSRAIYFRKDHPSPERVVEGLEKEMPAHVVPRINTAPWRTILRTRAALRVWRWIEEASPVSPTLASLLQEVDPDVMLVTPTIWPKTPVEADFFRAARSLAIPTIGYVNSWDNLTSKGTVHIVPDVYIVWNEPLAEEAVELHDIPPAALRITGAPHLDNFFSMRPSVTGDEMRREMGCPVDRPYVVFLCSSRTLMATELDLATRLADALARQFPDGPPTLVVRPHPTNPNPWEGFAHPGIVLHPRLGDQADSPESWQEYYNQLAHAACVFGLNTTAFLESVVADKPCLTIVSDEFWPAQGRTGHFRHLLKGDFLEVSRDAEEIAARVRRILDGADEKAAGRREFTRWFLRPCGLDTQPSSIVADVIERAARPARGASFVPAARDLIPGLTLASEGIGR
jgi:hypothetical protein